MIMVDRKVFFNIIEDLALMKESLELMADKKFMESYKSSKEQIKNRDFGDWDELQDLSD